MAVASYIRKTSSEKHDTESMNRAVESMVAEALKCNSVVNILDTDVEENIFSPEFIEHINNIPAPATRLEVLIKMLRRAISQYKDTNKIAAEKFEEMLKKTLEEYHKRRDALTAGEATATQSETVNEIVKSATEQAIEILGRLARTKKVSDSSALHSRRKPSTTFSWRCATNTTLSMERIRKLALSLSTTNARYSPRRLRNLLTHSHRSPIG